MGVTDFAIDQFLEDSSGYRGTADLLLQPATVAELAEMLGEANGKRIPVTIAGAGTGLTGARVPHGGLVISLARFQKLEITKGSARCGAGLALSELQVQAAKSRQFFGPNPTENSASVAGIISTNAGGARSFRFGAVRRHVQALQVAFADGRTVELKRGDRVDFPYQVVRQPQTTKNAAGYYLQPDLEWVDLLAGSEGTLGVVTEAELALLSEPPAILSGVVFFETEEQMLDAVDEWRRLEGLRLLESMDARALDLLRPQYPDISPRAQAALLIESDLLSEDDVEVDRWSERLEREGCLEDESWFGMQAADRERFRAFRHALPAMVVDRARHGNCRKFGTDFAVPLERNRDLYNYYRDRCDAIFPQQYTIFGHIGDANVHVNLLPDTEEGAIKAEALMEDFAGYVVSLGGTVAAEHGVGKLKTNLLKLMYSDRELDAMRDVKRHLDPNWLLGRGTIFEMPA
ncbi:MAG: FAD-binding oxidoreductase [Bryobacteraceae bacterium]